MVSFLLNPLMLFGLVGVALPLLAHLLSRKKFDVVEWGAMQFLEVSRKTRRRLQLEELLLLLLRMLIIAVLVWAMCRPWMSGSWLTRWISHQPRDVVIIIDGSYSMGWEGKAQTPHQAAVQRAHKFLEELAPGDTVALLDARDRIRPVIEPGTHDFGLVRRQLDALPAPSGSSDITQAVTVAVRMLAAGKNLGREVLILTDGQARSWNPTDEGRWELFDDLQQQQSIKPRIWALDVGEGPLGDRTNFSINRLEISREFAAVNLPVKVKATVRYTGGTVPLSRAVHFEVDGQRLAAKTQQTPQLKPNGEFGVYFEHPFTTTGSHLISVVLDKDNVPGDNRADAAITVADAIPVWLIDGDPHLDKTRSESFFAHAALSASENDAPLVQAVVLPVEQLTSEKLDVPHVVALMNVAKLTPAQADALLNYVAAGGGLLIAPGEKADPGTYHTLLYGDGSRVMPADLVRIETDQAKPPAPGVGVVDGSLTLPLVTPLRREHGGGFTEARFAKWWNVTLAPSAKGPVDPAAVKASEPIVAAKLSNQNPFLILRTYGRGRVAMLTGPLDSEWSTLPAKSDYVPFLHELVFHLAGGASPSRNVMVGEPLIMPVARGTKAEDFVFRDPTKQDLPAKLGGDETRPLLRLDQADLPGLYQLLPTKELKQERPRGEQFVVNFDRGESDLKLLTEPERKQLEGKGRLKFVQEIGALVEGLHQDGRKTEYWQFLMILVLCFYVGELLLTRRLVSGGHQAGAAAEANQVDDVELVR